LKLKLFWNGTLIRSATGFCVFFARSALLSLSAPDGAAGCSARSGLARRPRSSTLPLAHRFRSRIVASTSPLPSAPLLRGSRTLLRP
jgi:hypothetical protein